MKYDTLVSSWRTNSYSCNASICTCEAKISIFFIVPQKIFSVGKGKDIPSFHVDIYRPPTRLLSSTTATFSDPMQSLGFLYTGHLSGCSSAYFPVVFASFLDSSSSHPFTPSTSQIFTYDVILPSHIQHP